MFVVRFDIHEHETAVGYRQQVEQEECKTRIHALDQLQRNIENNIEVCNYRLPDYVKLTDY